MGSFGFSLDYKAGHNEVNILLKAAGTEANPKGCIPMIPEVEGATLTATAGGLLVGLPSDPSTSSGSGENNSEEANTGTEPVEGVEVPTGLSAIRMDVDNRFITALGETRQLTATLLDADGNPLSQDGAVIEWSTNRPQDLSVSTDGVITALVGLGYAEVFVRVSGTDFVDSVVFDITDPSFFTNTGGSSAAQTNNNDLAEKDEGIATEPAGSEFLVNTLTAGFQYSPAIAMDADGDFVVVWASEESAGSDSDDFSIQGQRYHRDGRPNGEQFQVNTATTGHQSAPSVAMDEDGNFVVAWLSDSSLGSDNDGKSIQGQRFHRNGSPNGIEFQINTYTANGQFFPSVAMDVDGDFVVAWLSMGSYETDTDNYSIQGQRYDRDGSPDGDQFQINTYTTGLQWFPSAAMDADGDFVVTWGSSGSYDSDTDSYSIQGQRYDRDGSPDGEQFQVNTYTNGLQSQPSAAMDADGDFIVTWFSGNTNASIEGQRFHSDGRPKGDQFQVNTYNTDIQLAPSVAMDADGDFVVTWRSAGSFGSDTYYSIQGQRYNSDGNPNGTEFQINTTTTDAQRTPAVAIDENGDFVVVWADYSSTGEDSDQSSIKGQRYQ